MTSRKIRLTVTILLIQIVSSVRVFMKSDVRFQLGDEKAVIPCSFNRTNTNALFNILWKSDTGLGTRVIERASSGAVFTGQHFKETASLGEGCTLILQNPKPQHIGTYWARVIVVGEGADTKAVKLIINSKESDKTYTRTVIPDQTPFIENITTPATDHGTQQTHFYLRVVAGFGIPAVILIAACLIIIHICNRRGEKTPDSLSSIDPCVLLPHHQQPTVAKKRFPGLKNF